MTKKKRGGGSYQLEHELLLRILAALAVHFPEPLPEPDKVLGDLTAGNREALFMHVMYLHYLGFMRSNLVELFRSTGAADLYHPARLSWGEGPVLTRKGLNAHLGVEPVVW
ncbi:hypothetical protein Cmtc_08630 [Cupriavidus sp. TKC]|uniref:hypothetical protein n=1 Tax=Cupriavidus sp. TKC TaxID=2880159 RepID=UPI0025A8BEFC|nr:hypothetical protein [Cupriavidus sp. TKC]GMG89643.1 hypothetical protein Cmtc_08630 [Cupriavidus sp. TKC]